MNWHNIHETPQKITEILYQKKPDIIGFSILHANRWGGIEIARIAKKINPDVKIVFGGIGATFLWQHFLTHFPEVDYVVIGEGEYSFLNLIQCLDNKEFSKIENINGIAHRKDGQPIKNPAAKFIRNLDDFPNPAKYFEYQHLSLTRGCPADCTFCGSPQFWDHRVRFHSADYFVDELERLYRKGITFFYVSDDTFTINKKRVIVICKKIVEKKLKITWVAISRVDCVNEEILYWMRKAGCIQISYGVESGSEKIRRFLNKEISRQQIIEAFTTTSRYGILARAYFIYGSPNETWETIQKTIDLINDIKPLSVIFYILDIFPGTKLYDEYKKKHRVTDDIWLNRVEDIMYFETDAKFSRELILAFGKKLRTSFYENLPGFAESLDLKDDQTLYPLHADFCSRLAMTFDQGDYANIDAIPGKERTAEKLYKKALSYYPDPRAYLGLGIIYQKQQIYPESIQILTEGLVHFPDDHHLNLCLGISHMNVGAYDRALSVLIPLRSSKEALQYIINCYLALNDTQKASQYQARLNSVQ